MQLPPLLRPAVVLGIACYPRSRAGPSARRGCAARRAAGAAGWHPAAAAGRQHAAARALLPRHLGPVVLHRRDDGEREIQGAAPGRRLGAVALHAAPLVLLAGTQRQRQAGSTQQPAPCCLATSARSCFIGVMMANARSKEQRRAVGSARLRCTPRRCGAAGWHPAAAASRQHACSGFKPRRRTGAVQSCCCMSR